jgi:hypothetical protein
MSLHSDTFVAGYRICGVMVSVLTSSVVDRQFEPRSDQTIDYNIVGEL